ncbi:hypothetical protein QIT38_gp13 [Methanocaldococcus fervens tailed virus 1]|uniref:Phage major capsid protein n=2 Tax=root TaxID=1 RepID=C7P5H5_METFA|nr:hypothetical protein [Methanocaldococcus fervens]YP_010772308.1 hypothetical protein QIT38_gp13 [Methanocaldococcus fervens tailed virus 1]ACV25353.1 hypothetical protein Mefer_1550 [Methanocaldococcus fervens AG86]QNO11483.1 hypothetical protein [Methanocaldococcus fervens tailed virus 1]
MALTAREAEIVKKAFKQIHDSQNFIRKIMPKQKIDKDKEVYTVETIELDESILSETSMEVIEIPYKTSSTSKRIFDLAAKLTRPRRLLTPDNFTKLSLMLAKIITKSENYYGINELLTNSTVESASKSWDAATPKDIVKDIQNAVIQIQQYTNAPINMVLPTSKATYFKTPNDYGLSPENLLKGTITNVFITNLVKDKAILVPADPTVVSFNVAEDLKVDKKEDLNTAIIWATEAICPSVDLKEAVIVLSGI